MFKPENRRLCYCGLRDKPHEIDKGTIGRHRKRCEERGVDFRMHAASPEVNSTAATQPENSFQPSQPVEQPISSNNNGDMGTSASYDELSQLLDPLRREGYGSGNRMEPNMQIEATAMNPAHLLYGSSQTSDTAYMDPALMDFTMDMLTAGPTLEMHPYQQYHNQMLLPQEGDYQIPLYQALNNGLPNTHMGQANGELMLDPHRIIQERQNYLVPYSNQQQYQLPGQLPECTSMTQPYGLPQPPFRFAHLSQPPPPAPAHYHTRSLHTTASSFRQFETSDFGNYYINPKDLLLNRNNMSAPADINKRDGSSCQPSVDETTAKISPSIQKPRKPKLSIAIPAISMENISTKDESAPQHHGEHNTEPALPQVVSDSGKSDFPRAIPMDVDGGRERATSISTSLGLPMMHDDKTGEPVFWINGAWQKLPGPIPITKSSAAKK